MTLQELRAVTGERCHLAILVEPFLTKLLAGEKTVESRWMKNKIAPYGCVDTNDLVYVKKSGGPIVASFRVQGFVAGKTESSFGFTSGVIRVARNNKDAICIDDNFIDEQEKTKNYGVLIFIKDLKQLTPFSVEKPGMAGWVVLP